MLPTKFRFIWPCSFREEDFQKLTNQKQEFLWWPCLLTNQGEMSNLYRAHSKDASYQISVHLGKWFQRKRHFRNQPIRNKNGLWWPCLLTDQPKMNNLQRGPCKDASDQVSIHLAKWFQRRFFRNQPIRIKNCLWWPCLLTDQYERINLYRGPSKDASYQISIHLAKRFQRRFFRNQPIRNKNCLWRPCL